MERCVSCASPNLSPYIADGHTGGYAPDGVPEFAYDIGVRCGDCGTVEDFSCEIPELDQLDEILEYYAEAPLGEPPPEPAPARKMPQRHMDPLHILTPRERQIALLIAQGHTNKEIAGQLGTVEQTVKNQVSGICSKLKVSNRTEIALQIVRAA